MHHNTTADLYLRLSLDRDGKTAIERQEADCRAWCERNGITVRKVHIDRGRSGYKTVARKGFDAALAAVTAGVVGILVVWKLDRLSRKGIGEVGRALDEFQRVGGRLVSVMDGLDTANDSARVTIALLAELARNESRNIGARVSSAKSYLRQQGKWGQGQPPYGLRVDPRSGKLIHSEDAVYARLIADELLDGRTPLAVARFLNEHEIPSPRGGTWRENTIVNLMRSPAFAGLMPESEHVKVHGEKKWTHRVTPYRDPETLDTVPIGEGIVSEGEREQILALIESRTFFRDGRKRPRRQGNALLTGVIYCENCDSRMHLVGNSYQCSDRRAGGNCVGASAYGQTVDRMVGEGFVSFLPALDPDDPTLWAVADRWAAKQDPETHAKRAAIEGELKDTEARMADLEDARYVRGEFNGPDAVKRYERLAGRLSARISGLRADFEALPTASADIGALMEQDVLQEAWEHADTAKRRELLSLAVDRVVIRKGKRGQRLTPDRVRIVWAGEDA